MDFDFVFKLIADFVDTKAVQKRLKLIDELCGTQGKRTHDYEKWLQIEFAMFLHQNEINEVADWGRERRYNLDGRKKDSIKSKQTTTVDFWLKRKYQKISGETLIEFKRAKSINGCVSRMIKDGSLLRKITKSKHDIRSFWMVGFHPSENESHNVFDKAFKQEERQQEWVKYRNIKTRSIKGTGLSFSVFTLDEA